jgi:hypothetical protein
MLKKGLRPATRAGVYFLTPLEVKRGGHSDRSVGGTYPYYGKGQELFCPGKMDTEETSSSSAAFSVLSSGQDGCCRCDCG